MAIDMNNSIRRKMARHPNILFRRKTYWFRRVIRYALRKIDIIPLELGQNFKPKWNSFKGHAEQLQRDGFIFVENFLDDFDAEVLRRNWPGSRYFVPISPNEDHKTSDKGHVCDFGKPLFDIARSPYMWKLFQMFLDDSFTNEVATLCDDGIARYPYHMLAQNSFWGSGLAPHRDSEDNKYTNKINFLIIYIKNG